MIGLFGGSFDPVHHGHLIAAQVAREVLQLAEVRFIPTGIQPFKGEGPQAPAADRIAMLQLALARGHRWLALPESGEAKLLRAIAASEGVGNSYVSRMVNLTALAPDIVDAILQNALPDHLTLFDLAVDPPALWEEQRARMATY